MTLDHVFPFHRAETSVSEAIGFSDTTPPTAMQNVRETQETESMPESVGAGMGNVLQVPLDHRIEIGRSGDQLGEVPTVMHHSWDGQDTAVNAD
jgi:hypothetical protein